MKFLMRKIGDCNIYACGYVTDGSRYYRVHVDNTEESSDLCVKELRFCYMFIEMRRDIEFQKIGRQIEEIKEGLNRVGDSLKSIDEELTREEELIKKVKEERRKNKEEE